MADFDTELNYDLHKNVQDSQTNTVASIIGGTVATVTDIGASLWNSLPGTPEVDTADLLGRISTDALKVYEENPDTIKTASFIGGMVLPMGLAVKGMNLMRNGSKAVNWFTNAGREADMLKVGELFKNAAASTAEAAALRTSIYAKTAANQAIDALAAEVAMVTLMNAHPYMEDYMKDLPQNFAISAVMGGALGAGVGVIADRFALKQVTGKAFDSVLNDTLGNLRSVEQGMNNATQLQSHEINILALGAVMDGRKALGKDETNDLLFAVAKNTQLHIKEQQAQLFETMISDGIKKLPTPEKDTIMREVIAKPEMFGVESIGLLTEKEVTAKGLIKAPKFGLDAKPSLEATQSSKGPIQPKNKDAVYFPELKLYGTKQDAIHYAGAATLGLDANKLAQRFAGAFNFGRIPNIEASIELIGKSSAHVEAEYIAAMTRVKDMSLDDLKNLHISETDGPLLNAVIVRMMKDPEAALIKIKTSDRTPMYDAVIEKRTRELISEGKITATGPDASYQAAVDRFLGGKKANNFDPSSESGQIASLLSAWRGGDKGTLGKMSADHHIASFSVYKDGVDRTNINTFEKLYNSKGSIALRAEFQKLADADGMVYLYRGVKTDNIRGHAPLESYTTHVDKAEQFGTRKGGYTSGGVKLYKVHVEDIVAAFEDVGGGQNRTELIVRAGARPVEATLDADGKTLLHANQQASKSQVVKETVETITTKGGTAAKEVGPQELQEMLIAQKQDAIDSLLANGIPMESIAKKTNTPVTLVKAYGMSKQYGWSFDSFLDPALNPMAQLSTISKYDDIEKVLASTNQPLVLSGNLKKNKLFTENHIALNNRQVSQLNQQFIATSLLAAKSETTDEFYKMLFHPEGLGTGLDTLKAKIGMMNNERGGSGFFNSLDFFARNMEDVGPIVSAIGKKVQQISNNMIKRVTTPITEAMTVVRKDAGAMTEYATFFNINASLKGWRGFTAEGKLVQKVEKEILDPVTNKTKKGIVLEPVKYQGQEYTVVTPSVRKLIMEQQKQSGELKKLADTMSRIKGSPPINDIGLWIPSFNPVNKFIAYVHNTNDDTTKLLFARTATEYENLVNAAKSHIKETGQEGVNVVTKKEQAQWNILNGRLDPINMEIADISMQKTGSSSAAVIKPDIALFGEIAGGYEHHITAQVRNITDLSISEVTDPLRKISSFNRRLVENQPLTDVKKAVVQPKDTASMMLNALLGGSNLGEYAGWRAANKSFETVINMAANTVSDLWAVTVKPLTKTFFGGKKELDIASVKKIDFKKFNDELEARGIMYPWKELEEEAAKKLGFFNIESNPDTTKRVVYASNALAATMALRFGELAQPLVNALSMPILTGLAIAQKMPETFMGVQKGTANVSGVQIMYEGIRAMHSPHFKALNARWEKEGYFAAMVSEASDVLRATRAYDKGPIAGIENMLDSSVVSVMSKPADWTESLTRKAAMNTGAVLAKRLYPELDDVGITIFARDFMDKAIGNFHASQRPVMFQGTLGVALGLFQTYTLTLGQSIYRHLELKNYKALGKAALTQTGIFGTGSLPGFDVVSNAIGDHFSDDNVDLMTGTYRAVNDKIADFILYGLPSNLGPAVNTRGDVDPRLPIVNNMVAYNFVTQTMDVMSQLHAGLAADAPDKARAFAQALSLQNMSRPVARLAELTTGYSMTRRGNTVQTPEEVWTFTGISSRLLATRPIEEQKLRDADHLNHFYGALDRDNREVVVKELKTSIRGGTLTDEKLAKIVDSYMRNGGTPAGWRSAYKTAIAKTDTSGKETFVEKLRPDNPIMYMMDSMD